MECSILYVMMEIKGAAVEWREDDAAIAGRDECDDSYSNVGTVYKVQTAPSR